MACSALMCYRGVVFVHKFANFESKDNSALTTPTVRDKWRGLALGVGIVGDTPVQGDSAKRASLRFLSSHSQIVFLCSSSKYHYFPPVGVQRTERVGFFIVEDFQRVH